MKILFSRQNICTGLFLALLISSIGALAVGPDDTDRYCCDQFIWTDPLSINGTCGMLGLVDPLSLDILGSRPPTKSGRSVDQTYEDLENMGKLSRQARLIGAIPYYKNLLLASRAVPGFPDQREVSRPFRALSYGSSVALNTALINALLRERFFKESGSLERIRKAYNHFGLGSTLDTVLDEFEQWGGYDELAKLVEDIKQNHPDIYTWLGIPMTRPLVGEAIFACPALVEESYPLAFSGLFEQVRIVFSPKDPTAGFDCLSTLGWKATRSLCTDPLLKRRIDSANTKFAPQGNPTHRIYAEFKLHGTNARSGNIGHIFDGIRAIILVGDQFIKKPISSSLNELRYDSAFRTRTFKGCEPEQYFHAKKDVEVKVASPDYLKGWISGDILLGFVTVAALAGALIKFRKPIALKVRKLVAKIKPGQNPIQKFK